MKVEHYRVQARVHLDRIYRNIERTKQIINPDTKIVAIVKADAYGHGAVPVAKILEPLVAGYGVAMVEEGIELRENGIKKPILILGFTPECNMKELVSYEITPAVYTLDMAKWVSKEAVAQNKTVKVHLKIDTGMGRIGFALTDESVNTIKQIANLPGIEIEGCFSHFSKADEKDLSFTKLQLERYNSFIAKLEEVGIKIPVQHISNSAGAMMVPEANKYMVRSGITTYGLYPSEDVDKSRLYLEPAMEWKTHVSFVKTLPKGVGISYGGTFVTEKETKVATIPVGYADGYPRSLSSKGYVLVNGKKANILGRVCMDQFMVDVTEIEDVKIGDAVTLFGQDGDANISVEEISELAGSFNYEFVCDVHKRIPRIYLWDNKVIGGLEVKNCVNISYPKLG